MIYDTLEVSAFGGPRLPQDGNCSDPRPNYRINFCGHFITGARAQTASYFALTYMPVNQPTCHGRNRIRQNGENTPHLKLPPCWSFRCRFFRVPIVIQCSSCSSKLILKVNQTFLVPI